MMRPPFEEGVCFDLIRVVSEDTATLGKNLIEFLQGLEVFIDDGLIRQRPQAFGGLDLWRIRRQEHQFNALRNHQIPGDVPACAVEYQCQSASNNQPASASNIQPLFWLQNSLSRESMGGSRARRGVPVMADVAARVGGTCGPPWARHGRKEGQERFLNRQLSFPVSRISQW